jgi:transcriptional regulator with PAS, ATPase and Fis domain
MKIEKASKSELIVLLRKMLEDLSEPVFVVSRNFKVVYSNNAYENFVQKTAFEINGSDFGNTLGCSYLTKDTKTCGSNYFCELCSIRNAIVLSFENNNGNGDFVRDFNLAEEIVFRHIVFKTFKFKINEIEYVAITINRSETDINAADMELELLG